MKLQRRTLLPIANLSTKFTILRWKKENESGNVKISVIHCQFSVYRFHYQNAFREISAIGSDFNAGQDGNNRLWLTEKINEIGIEVSETMRRRRARLEET